MSYMHEGEPYGHLTIDGTVPNLQGIASLVARPVSEVRKALDELESRQVFSRSESGAIFSRRMVRDNERSEEGRKHAAKRDEPPPKPSGLPLGSPSREPSTQNLESKIQKVKPDLFGVGEKADGNARPPPRHGLRSSRYGTIFIKHDTDEWPIYAADFKEVRGAEPIPNRHGGYWFMANGERDRRPNSYGKGSAA